MTASRTQRSADNRPFVIRIISSLDAIDYLAFFSGDIDRIRPREVTQIDVFVVAAKPTTVLQLACSRPA